MEFGNCSEWGVKRYTSQTVAIGVSMKHGATFGFAVSTQLEIDFGIGVGFVYGELIKEVSRQVVN